jgi:D-alanyl-D-alanine carboxypeptidase
MLTSIRAARAVRRRLGLLAAVALLALVPACTRPASKPPAAHAAGGAAVEPAGGRPAATTAPPGTAPPSTRPPVLLPARFHGSVAPLPAGLAAQMRGTTWRPGCPVPLADLRLLTLRYWGFDGLVHEGPMVVHRAAARGIVSVFRRLFAARFPIQRLHLAVQYRIGDDDPNDMRDYTAGFNCRPVVTASGPLSTWSQHAYGLAVDINPIQNPFVASDGLVRNVHARPYRDRSLQLQGMIRPGDVVVRAFAAIGWTWGGSWSHDKDYMHFSANGR